MKFSSVFVGSIYLLAQGVVSTPVSERSAHAQFYLVPVVTEGLSKFNGGSIQGFHTGAGQNAAIRVPRNGVKFILNGTSLQVAGSKQLPFTIGVQDLKPYNSTAPKNYKYVNMDAGFSKGFDINKVGIVEYRGKQPLETFVICHVNGIAPYFTVGPQNQLLWRPKTGKASYDHCADVVLQAKYV